MSNFFNKKEETIKTPRIEKLESEEMEPEKQPSNLQKDSWIAKAEILRKQNEKNWKILTRDEIKEGILTEAQKGEVEKYFFKHRISKEDKSDLTELGYKVEEGFHHDAPYVKVSWK